MRINGKIVRRCMLIGAILALAPSGGAQTLITGNISGTWAAAGNPYILTGDTTVPAGQTLTIQPGVAVLIPPNVSFVVSGTLLARGLPDPNQHIRFSSTGSGTFWKTVLIDYTPGSATKISYCDFQNATNALTLQLVDKNASAELSVLNCTFSNCVDYALIGYTHGLVYQDLGGFHYFIPSLSLSIRNCTFQNCYGGTKITSAGTQNVHPFYGFVGNLVYASASLYNNIYAGISNSAIYFSAEQHTAAASARVSNCTIAQANTGLEYYGVDPGYAVFAVDIGNTIFSGCTNGIIRNAAIGLTSYNCFWNVQTNFAGYPPTYGSIALNNRNGTPCDVAFDIFEDPRFISSSDLHLATNSPCIDAGTPNPAFCDLCLSHSPSQGTQFPDLGVYGGPDACNWLDEVPLLRSQTSMSITNGLIWLNWGGIPRSDYKLQYLAELPNVGTPANWIDLANGVVTAVDKPVAIAVAPLPTTNTMKFFRVESLGRTPGN